FARLAQALAPIRALGLGLDPALAGAVFDRQLARLTGPLAADAPSETVALPAGQSYLNWLVYNGLDTVRSGAPPGGANTLLFALLRHALLREYATATLRIVRARGLAQPGEGDEPGLADGTPPSHWTRLAAPLYGVTARGQTLGQAATAAVLRSGHLADLGDDGAPLAIDLSSRRVRLALALLDGVRAGQPLAALLGYRLERGLHENHRELVLDRYIAALRALAPLDALTASERDLSVALDRQTEAVQVLGQLQ